MRKRVLLAGLSAAATGVLGIALIVAGGSPNTTGERPSAHERALRQTQQQIAEALQANSSYRLYNVVSRATRGDRSRAQFAASIERETRRTGPVTVARFTGRSRVIQTAAGPLMASRLRLRYARAAGGDYTAYLVREDGRWKLWRTEARGRGR